MSALAVPPDTTYALAILAAALGIEGSAILILFAKRKL